MAWDLGLNGSPPPDYAEAHGDAYFYGDLGRFDLVTKMSGGIKLYVPADADKTGSSIQRNILGKYATPSGVDGFFLSSGITSNEKKLQLTLGSGTTNDSLALTVDIETETEFSLFWRIDLDEGVGDIRVDSNPPDVKETWNNTDFGETTNEFSIGNRSFSTDDGFACQLAHPMLWLDYYMPDGEVAKYQLGREVPAPSNLSLWVTCIDETSANTTDKVFGDTGTEQGAVSVVSRDFDGDFSSSGLILPHQFVAGMNMRLFRIAPDLLEVELPLEFLRVGLGDYFGVSHPDLPQAASLLHLIADNYAAPDWMHSHTFVIARGLNPETMTVKLRLLDLTPKMCFLAASAKTEESVNDSGEGEYVVNQGWTLDNDRGTTAYILDTSELAGGSKTLAPVAPFKAKTNHRGTLYEKAFKTLIANNAGLVDGSGTAIADWAESLGTGGTADKVTLVGSSVPRLFRGDEVLGYEAKMPRLIRGTAGDCVFEYTITPDDTDDSRLYVWYMGSTGTLKWWLQRDTDSNYWTGSTWSASKTWITIGTGTANVIDRYISDVITSVPASGATLTLGLGMESTDGNLFTVLPFKVDFVQEVEIVSDLVTLDSGSGLETSTSEADAPVWSIDNGGSDSRQTANYEHGSYRVTLYAEQDYDDLPNNTVHALGEWGIDDSNKDVLAINKDGSGDLYLKLVRYISGSQDAVASVEIPAFVRGTIYEAMGRWTSASGGELGLPARTLSAFWQGAKGTDAEASGVHSSSDQTTHFRPGNSSQSGFDPAFNFISDYELVPYALPDESALGERRAS